MALRFSTAGRQIDVVVKPATCGMESLFFFFFVWVSLRFAISSRCCYFLLCIHFHVRCAILHRRARFEFTFLNNAKNDVYHGELRLSVVFTTFCVCLERIEGKLK